MRWISIVCILYATALEAQNGVALCTEWGEAREVGQLDPAIIPEASGIEVSSVFPDRLYHVDDSSTRIYVTDSQGNLLQSVSIEGTGGTDIEDLALGPCGETTCLFIADIGDNSRRRDSIEVIVVEEVEEFSQQVLPRHRIRLRYPEGPIDAEALGVSTNGDIFVISRRLFPEESQTHAELFRLPGALWQNSGVDQTHTLEHLSSIEMRRFESTLPGRLVTAMDFSADNRRMLLLTYADAFEFQVDSDERGVLGVSLVEGQGYMQVSLAALRQQEGIAYLPGDDGFVYTTEAGPGPAPIMRVDCVRND